MKKLTKPFLIFILLSLTAGSCKKDDDDDSDNFSEYFYCKINGEEFQTRSTFICNSRTFYYYPAGTAGLPDDYILISGKHCPSNKSVTIRLYNPVPTTGYLHFLEPAFADSCSPFYRHTSEEGLYIMMENLISGSMNIETFTPRDSITLEEGRIEGTFEFSVTNENQDSIIHITEGVFRFKVPNMW